MHIRKFSVYFSIFQCIIHHPISVTNLCCSLNHVRDFISSCLQNLSLLNFALRGSAARQPPPPPTLHVGCADVINASRTRIYWQENKIRPNSIVNFVNYGFFTFINCILLLYFDITEYFQAVYWNSHDFSRCRFADLVGLLVHINMFLKGKRMK